MNQKKTENGRSMVEMLGVLAVIGVLSIGGIAGYRMAMKKNIENDFANFFQYIRLMAETERFNEYSNLAAEDYPTRNNVLCQYVGDNYCQPYVSPADGHTDANYYMSNHFFWRISYLASFPRDTEACGKDDEIIKVQADFRAHHPNLETDPDLCKNLVTIAEQTFGDMFCGFNIGSMGLSADTMRAECENGKGFQIFNVILSQGSL